jgi:RHS repeat-associated protein
VNYPNYDAVGNRLQLTSTLSAVPTGSSSFDANDRLTTDTYDNDGNTISSGGISNIYDFENRMLSHGGVSIVYDGDGNRIMETVSGATTQYLIDTLNPTHLPQVLDEVMGGSVIRTYAYGLQRISENQITGTTWSPSFYGYDGHGNVRFLTNTSGTVTDAYQYDAFGIPIASTGPTANNYRFSGEWFDSNIGLYHLRARYYSMLTGRFETMDPNFGNILDPGTLHSASRPVGSMRLTGLLLV